MGSAVTFSAADRQVTGYLATPADGTGPGVVVLHAWWGLTPFVHGVCERLARAGFVTLAPDLHHGQTADTIVRAEQLLTAVPYQECQQDVLGAMEYLGIHPAVSAPRLGAVGFSMGAYWALLASTLRPAQIAAAVAFYGTSDADFARARAAYLALVLVGLLDNKPSWRYGWWC